MNLLLLASILYSAIYQASCAYPFSPSDRLALRSYLRDEFLGNINDAMDGPATREESAANNKLIIPPNTFVSGGTGEGKQHLGATGKIPNKQVAIPEVHAGYSTPPNPCPKTTDNKDKESVKSILHPRLTCYCEPGWQESEEETEDCTGSNLCCLASMSNTAAFVSQYQETGEAEEQQYLPFKRNKFTGGEKRDQLVAKKSPEMIAKRSPVNRRFGQKRHNPYLDDQPHMDGVVAKKSPGFSGFPAM